jgi:hypothetical protein
MKKIDVYINGVYEFSSTQYKSCKELVNHIRATKHLVIASVPENKYLTVYDYDTIRAMYAK